MAQFDFVKGDELEITEELTLNMDVFEGGGIYKIKPRHNLKRDLDDRVASQNFEALIDQVVDEQQSEFRKFLAPLYDSDVITSTQITEIVKWIWEERDRLEREAVAKKAGRPTGGRSRSGS